MADRRKIPQEPAVPLSKTRTGFCSETKKSQFVEKFYEISRMASGKRGGRLRATVRIKSTDSGGLNGGENASRFRVLRHPGHAQKRAASRGVCFCFLIVKERGAC